MKPNEALQRAIEQLTPNRYAVVDIPYHDDIADWVQRVGSYLPENYDCRYALVPSDDPTRISEHYVLIYGRDWRGWSLDGYVIPRLASGLIVAREVDQ